MKFSIAISVSLAVHVLIGAGIWAYMEYAPAPDVSASLDLTSVELSFAEEESDTAPRAVAQSAENPAPVSEMTEPEFKQDQLKLEEKIPDAVDIPEPKPELRTPNAPAKPEPETASAPRQARIDAPPRPKRNIKPDYPKGARQRGEQGDVTIEMRVNEHGVVDRAEVVSSSGFAELDEAAVRAVRAAKFTPAKSGRDSVASSARITLTFKLK